jgi:16S rRNA (cytidine1402-2'-O)-methyltransferase
MAGTLFVVATPIGNLEDLTFRALRTLREVDLIAAEDTRRTSKLLAHYEVRKPLLSLREHNEWTEGPRLVDRLRDGESIALVSDAGTPAISDPGASLVALAREAAIRVVPIPGCSAITTALSAAGLPAARFFAAGFPPSGGIDRTEWFERLRMTPDTLVLLESPHRVERTLSDLRLFLSNRIIIVCRELTKINEELVECTNAACRVRPQGEFVIVVGPAPKAVPLQVEDASLLNFFEILTSDAVMPRDEATVILAQHFGLKPAEARKRVKKATISAKRQNR